MIGSIKKIISSQNQERQMKKYRKIVEQINRLEVDMEKLTDEELRAKTADFKEQLAQGKTIEDIKVEAFAVVREASKRVIGLRHYDVQLIGGLVLVEGNIAEMATGEGKTLVSSAAAYLRALEGKGVHIITVNDYLAKRDKELIGQIHEFLGLTVGLNLPQMSTSEKQAAYNCDITYGIGNEFGFDYLRDHMIYSKEQRVQRPYHFCIIDEIDSVLIDEAKTPLIIAGKSDVSSNLHNICAKLVKRMKPEDDYLFDPESKATSFTDEGITKIERSFGIDNLYDMKHHLLHHYMLQALRAHAVLKRDVDYIVREGEILLVDIFTGRVMDGRSYSDGLQQAIEAKEGLEITAENKTQATVTIQNYFRMYPTLSGMTGTAKTEEKEFRTVYNMQVIPIPTNKPRIRIDYPDLVYRTKDAKYRAVTKKIKDLHQNGQPILIGTSSIEQSEMLASYLDNEQLPYQLLNAKSAEKEAQLIAVAGQKGQITIATNMAGRGTDILLGEGVAKLGGLFVIGTERHESRRVDNQLKGRAGRQGDPGASQFFISLEDELFERFASEKLEKMDKSIKTDDNGLVLNKNILDFANRMQLLCEGSNYSAREYTLKLDDNVNEQRKVMYTLRNRFIDCKDIFDHLTPMMTNATKAIVERYCLKELLPEEWEIDKLKSALERILVIEWPSLNVHSFNDAEDFKAFLKPLVDEYELKLKAHRTDESIQFTLRQIALSILDNHWLDHLEAMTRLKEGIGMRGYAQEDPMRAYQKEGFDIFSMMFSELEYDISEQVAHFMKESVWNKEN